MESSHSTQKLCNEVKAYHQLTLKFKKSCSQVIHLNNMITDVQTRYDRALTNGQTSYRYVLRLRLMSLEGVRNCIYEYARQKGDEIDQLQEQLMLAGHMEAEYDVTDDEEEETISI